VKSASRSFAEFFCEQQGIPPEKFADAILRSALYPHARVVLAVCAVLGKRHLIERDREIVNIAGLSQNFGGVVAYMGCLPQHYGSGWPLRKLLRIRLSGRRLLKLAQQAFADSRHEPPHCRPLLFPEIGTA
jgi:hypothetical protein